MIAKSLAMISLVETWFHSLDSTVSMFLHDLSKLSFSSFNTNKTFLFEYLSFLSNASIDLVEGFLMSILSTNKFNELLLIFKVIADLNANLLALEFCFNL